MESSTIPPGALELSKIGIGSGQIRLLLGTRQGGYGYVGQLRPPVQTLLETALAWLPLERYQDVCIATGRGSHLPALSIDGQLTVGQVPGLWWYRPPPQKEETPAPTGRRPGFTELYRSQLLGTRRRLLASGDGWVHRVNALLEQAEMALGVKWNVNHYDEVSATLKRRILILDDPFLEPTEQERLGPTEAEEFRLRFEGISQRINRGDRLDLLILSYHPATSAAWQGEGYGNQGSSDHLVKGAGIIEALIVAKLAQLSQAPSPSFRQQSGIFPRLCFLQAKQIHTPSVDASQPWGDCFAPVVDRSRLEESGVIPVPPPPEFSFLMNLRQIAPRVDHPIESATQELQAMPGLQGLKSRLEGLKRRLKNIERFREGMSQEELDPGDWVFQGNPGTGKTTVARLMGRLLKGANLLERGHCVYANKEALVGQYVGHTAPMVRARFDEALGGVLFIDEVSNLLSGGEFGPEAIKTIVGLMEIEPYRTRMSVIIADYPDKIEAFLKHDAGLKSRFLNVIDFDNYSPAEMMEIFRHYTKDWKLQSDAEQRLSAQFQAWSRAPPQGFANARTIRQLADGVRGVVQAREDFDGKRLINRDAAERALQALNINQ